jgi:RNA recognition motif-containing protein
MKKIYVGNLPYRVTKDEFTAFFSGCGTVEDAHLVSDRQTGRAKGFGFVTFDSSEAAQAALRLNGQELQGRAIRIDLARESTTSRD